ncbi:MAG: hypothetical protein UU81_C0044G0016 [Microgenomates group bacterium GW2011_GWC1_41_8]|uniref:DUF4352 domain-containing protein n=3 Tax=Candidatus Roizmaniibacteriota TaxID=1752723 RepID=A0A0G0XCI9_9BACT|nr:MAG: hypothetical protein UU14_C0008G0018 [Candidatus Roizmanbacteria bacterium GW2011_GWB1_40_7]KKR94274.1 MAG: hypothetical protein UU41_C0009G0020 [Candidatus Roizmanbacteria bacterium GW2011_GWA1_41_13]KKS22092.1 MAG: hypothetical protein UU78_C0023G0018 [Candidatus Roizmanbacteria bacterium GW2011_GWC2_41_7]KKS22980.1 MAG: hypothetical protein UU81_C0044G0016 [Microgenomates group bacterium GW2011_GWC1_41_8]
MKYQKITIFTLAIIIVGTALYYVISNRANSSNSSGFPTQIEKTALQIQTLTDGAVTYKVIPKDLTTSATTWDFDVSIDTHTGSLDQDLVDIARLVDNKGNEYKATMWEGAAPGGHHREGILKFSPISPRPAFVELKIQTTSSTENNSLRWNI